MSNWIPRHKYFASKKWNSGVGNNPQNTVDSNVTPAHANGKVSDPSIKIRLETLLANPAVLANEFTTSFMKSLLEQFEKKQYLSQKQFDCITQNEEKFDPKNLVNKESEFQTWQTEFTQEKRDDIRKVAEFYKKQHEENPRFTPYYYQKTSEKVLNDPNFVPTRAEYDKMVTNNKFAQRYLKNQKEGSKFNPGDLIVLNSIGRHLYNLFPQETGIIIEVKSAKRNVKGATIYSILPTGTDRMIDLEERMLKSSRD